MSTLYSEHTVYIEPPRALPGPPRAPPEPPRADPDLHSLGAAFEQLLSKKASKIVVKHSENENSITKTSKQHSKIDNFEIGFSFSLFLCLKGAKMSPSADPADPADPPDPADQVSESAAQTLPSTRAGGQDDGSSQNKLPQSTAWLSTTQLSLV